MRTSHIIELSTTGREIVFIGIIEPFNALLVVAKSIMNTKTLFSHKTDHWKTPTTLYNKLMQDGYIDPCPFHSKEDNLNKKYKDQLIYINPPYSQIDKWVQFIKNNIKQNKKILLLIPARTDTKYFHELLEQNPIIYFIKGRLSFNDKGTAPFPSIIMEFKSNNNDIQRYVTLQKENLL